MCTIPYFSTTTATTTTKKKVTFQNKLKKILEAHI
jgi:hypothetical protein